MKTEHRSVTQDDMTAAQRGLRMAGKSPVQLQNLIDWHFRGHLFADRVIVAAAKQMLAAKRRMGAR